MSMIGGAVTTMVMTACYGAPPTDLQPPPDTGDATTGDTGATTADTGSDTGR